jgi:outer membrane protein with beta-barrel domain
VTLRYAILMGATLFATAGFSQEEPAKIDLYGEYSYLRFNPTLTGLPSRNFNGGGGGATLFFNDHFGVKGELMGYGSTTWTATFPAQLVVTPHGITETIPAGTFSSNANMLTYQFGPVVRMPMHSVTVFGETLFGGSNTNGYTNIERAIDAGGGTLNISGTQHPFSMAVGGGLDVNVSKSFAVRVGEFDYFLTRYTNPITSTNNQNNFRYIAGVVFRFH